MNILEICDLVSFRSLNLGVGKLCAVQNGPKWAKMAIFGPFEAKISKNIGFQALKP